MALILRQVSTQRRRVDPVNMGCLCRDRQRNLRQCATPHPPGCLLPSQLVRNIPCTFG